MVAFVSTAGDAKVLRLPPASSLPLPPLIGRSCAIGVQQMKDRVVQLLHQQDSSLAVVKSVLVEWSTMMGITESSSPSEVRLKEIVDAVSGLL